MTDTRNRGSATNARTGVQQSLKGENEQLTQHLIGVAVIIRQGQGPALAFGVHSRPIQKTSACSLYGRGMGCLWTPILSATSLSKFHVIGRNSSLRHSRRDVSGVAVMRECSLGVNRAALSRAPHLRDIVGSSRNSEQGSRIGTPLSGKVSLNCTRVQSRKRSSDTQSLVRHSLSWHLSGRAFGSRLRSCGAVSDHNQVKQFPVCWSVCQVFRSYNELRKRIHEHQVCVNWPRRC
uniref:Uncharacterized protein n=1 Tax=Toxoplasma gondii (strain ATCC 50861 / VEG) TaxID=432359 RepID=A0A0F7UWT3_TOXGV|nr:TPA: hypothetical protein BN1205_033780 [Toxoplasma gondii VEG]